MLRDASPRRHDRAEPPALAWRRERTERARREARVEQPSRALDSLPPDLARRDVERRRSSSRTSRLLDRDPLLGLYQGVPLTRRGAPTAGSCRTRSRVYRRPLRASVRPLDSGAAPQRDQARRPARAPAHHFGISDERPGRWATSELDPIGKSAGVPLQSRGPEAVRQHARGHHTSPEESHGQDRSQSCDHPRLHRVQAAELPDDEVEAEHARPRRVPEVLPLVRRPHAAPGDPLAHGRRAARERRRRPARRADRAPQAAQVEPQRRRVELLRRVVGAS